MDFEINPNYLDCINDSPQFRKNISLLFSKIVNFQDVITEISESFSLSIKSGIAFSCHYQTFCSKIEKLHKLYPDKNSFQSDIDKILKVFTQFKENFKLLMENFHMIQKDFKSFQDNFKEIEACKKIFQKSTENLENCQQKCASCPKSKVNECLEVDKQCNIARKEFTESSLTYLTKIEKYDIYKQSLFSNACIKIIEKKQEYYEVGDDFMKKLNAWSHDLKESKGKYDVKYQGKCDETKELMKYFTNHSSYQKENTSRNAVIEGYLYKYPRKSWQKWQRRWFCVLSNQLLSCKRNEDSFSIVEDDLRVCTAKELVDNDRRFCFELIGLDHTHVLQADDEDARKRWISCFQNGMSSQMGTLGSKDQQSGGRSVSAIAIGSESSSENNSNCERRISSQYGGRSTRRHSNKIPINNGGGSNRGEDRKTKLLSHVLNVRGNNLCCDCNDGKPRWASSSLGITLCTECSGSHRSLGVHISKVRSLTLDNWEPEMLCVMFMLGNELVNRIFESDKQAIANAAQSTTNRIVKPDSNTDMTIRKEWTRAKWEKKQFVQSNVKELLLDLECYIRENISVFAGVLQDGGYPFTSSSDLLRYGLEIDCLPLMMLALALNASPNGDESEDFIPLHLAASTDFWPGCEFLILNGAKIDIVDKNKQTALHKACQNENVLVVWLLLKRGARHNIRDNNENEVLQIAMNTTNANTVTLLRLQMLNENTKEANLGSSGDETVNDVFRDFTNRAFDQIDEWFNSESGRFRLKNSSKLLTNNVAL